MRKVIGIGETILDIIFQNNQPQKAVPGGSTFNCMISLGRCKVPALFISELGNDRVGELIKGFMKENNLSTDYIDFFEEGQSPVSMAFLDENQNAEYQFYKEFPKQRLNIEFPVIHKNDIVILGSYFAVNSVLREKVKALLVYAKKQGAIIYYDINFRKAHAGDRLRLMTNFIENFQYSTVVRCSDEDLQTLYPDESLEDIYTNRLSHYCNNWIITKGEKGVLLKTSSFQKEYQTEAVTPVSTIGAGDNFNAGFVLGLLQHAIELNNLAALPEKKWDNLIDLAQLFAKEVCLSMDNYVSPEFAVRFRQ